MPNRRPGLVALSLALLVVGCGGGDSPGSGGGGSTSSPGVGGSVSSQAGTPAGGGGQGGTTSDGGSNSAGGAGGAGGSGGSGGSGAIDDPGPGPTQDCPISKDGDGFFTLTSAKSDYIARLPASYDPAHPAPTRLLVALHGCGDTAYNHATWAAVPYALRDTQDYIAISVGGREHSCWTVPGDKDIVDAAIEHVRSCFYVHQKKIVLAGYSSGGDLTYLTSMHDAAKYAGILIEHSDLTQNVGAANVAPLLAGAAWKLNISIRAGDNDTVYPIATVKGDFQKMMDAGFPAKLVETQDTHNGTSDDWAALIPQMSTWLAP